MFKKSVQAARSELCHGLRKLVRVGSSRLSSCDSPLSNFGEQPVPDNPCRDAAVHYGNLASAAIDWPSWSLSLPKTSLEPRLHLERSVSVLLLRRNRFPLQCGRKQAIGAEGSQIGPKGLVEQLAHHGDVVAFRLHFGNLHSGQIPRRYIKRDHIHVCRVTETMIEFLSIHLLASCLETHIVCLYLPCRRMDARRERLGANQVPGRIFLGTQRVHFIHSRPLVHAALKQFGNNTVLSDERGVRMGGSGDIHIVLIDQERNRY